MICIRARIQQVITDKFWIGKICIIIDIKIIIPVIVIGFIFFSCKKEIILYKKCKDPRIKILLGKIEFWLGISLIDEINKNY